MPINLRAEIPAPEQGAAVVRDRPHSSPKRENTVNILLVSPATPVSFWSYKHVLPLISRKAAFPPLGLLTVAAMLPDEWNLRLVDLYPLR